MPSPNKIVVRRTLRLVRLGVVAELRNPALRLLGAAAFVGAGVFAWNQGAMAASTGVTFATWLSRVFGIAACLWLAYSAIRDQNERGGAVLRSKPVDGGYWVFLNWASAIIVWLILLLAPFLGAAIGQFAHQGGLSLYVHGWSFLRAAVVVASVGTLSFSLSRMMGSPLGGIIVMFAWFCAMAGLEFVPTYLQPDFAQNAVLFVPAALTVLALAGLFVERLRRGELRRPLVPLAVLFGLVVVTGSGAAHAYRRTPSLYEERPSVWSRIALQHLQAGQRVPGFWLPDGKGGVVRTADHHGKILFVYMFDALDLNSARALPALETLQREMGPQGVQVIGIALSRDHGAALALGRTGGYSFPIGADLATVNAGTPPESAVAVSWNAQLLPGLVVTDRRRIVRAVLNEPIFEISTLRRLAHERLAVEPE
jgi:hypothetical protein